jgi:hypothetical protein
MAKTAPRTILLRGRGYRDELEAAGAITPGHLVMRNSSNKAVVCSADALPAATKFAVEAEHLGNPANASGDIDQAYASGDLVQIEHVGPGCHVLAIVAAGAAAIAIGDNLQSAGDGTLEKATLGSQLTTGNYTYTAPGIVLAKALEAVDNSGGSDPVRIKVEII